MSEKLASLCVYCGSSFGTKPEYQAAAETMGKLLAENGIRLIYGGGHVGLMGVIADAVMDAGGQVTGVIPQALMDREVGHGGLTELHVVRDMHERKMMMAELADGFIAMPGGWGTLEELTEMLTWRQLGIHSKPIGLLNTSCYFDGFVSLMHIMMDEGFVRAEHGRLFVIDSEPKNLLNKLNSVNITRMDKWATKLG